MVLLAQNRPIFAVCSFAAVANLALVVFVERPAAAVLVRGFDGPFAPANWTPSANTTLDQSGAPGSLSISGMESGSLQEQLFTISVPLNIEQDTLSTTWNYSTDDLTADLDIFGYMINGIDFVNISDPFGSTIQAGSFRIKLDPSDTFSFAIKSIDDFGGTATVNLSDFQAGLDSEVPKCSDCRDVPGPLPALGVISAYSGFKRLKMLKAKLQGLSS